MKSKSTEHSCRTIEFEDVTASISAAHAMTANGYKWIYDEDGAHFFSKGDYSIGFSLMRCLPSDMTNGNFQFMSLHGLTNTNRYDK